MPPKKSKKNSLKTPQAAWSAKKQTEEALVQDKEVVRHRKSSFFDWFPSEILEIIFSYLRLDDRKNVRLVCKSWYSNCNKEENLHIKWESDQKYFQNCGIRKLNVRFDHTPVISLWSKTGSRIQSLDFHRCKLGNQTIKNLILLCDNLRILRIKLINYDPYYSFCSPETLEEMNFTRKKLGTLEISGEKFQYPADQEYDYEVWRRIIIALLRIFQNTTYFISGLRHNSNEYFTCSFSAELEAIDQLELSSSLAFLLSNYDKDWSNAFVALSSTRLTTFSLEYSRYLTERHGWSLRSFFEKQKQLKSVKVKLGTDSRESPSSDESSIMASVILHITNHCCELQELELHESRYRFLIRSWLASFSPSLFYAKTLNIRKLKLSVDTVIEIERSSPPLSLSLNWNNSYISYNGRNLFTLFMKNHLIEHLTVIAAIPDDFLQTIFKHMINLKTLDLRLDSNNTNFCLNGQGDKNVGKSIYGYSIKCLKNLEKLTIRCEEFNYDDTIFDEFDFPKLRYLYCFPPKELSMLPNLIARLPCLEEIAFRKISDPFSLIDFCKSNEKLHTIELPDLKRTVNTGALWRIFDVCPSLKYLRTQKHTYFYGPYSKEIRCIRRFY